MVQYARASLSVAGKRSVFWVMQARSLIGYPTPLVVVVRFRDGKLSNEHISWSEASVLVQLGLLDSTTLPVAGVLIRRARD